MLWCRKEYRKNLTDSLNRGHGAEIPGKTRWLEFTEKGKMKANICSKKRKLQKSIESPLSILLSTDQFTGVRNYPKLQKEPPKQMRKQQHPA